MGKDECEAQGGEWVARYRKKDGTVVRGFCRDIGEARKQGYSGGETPDGYHYYSFYSDRGSSGGWETPEELAKALEDLYPEDKITVTPSRQIYAEDRQTHKKTYLGLMEHKFISNEDI